MRNYLTPTLLLLVLAALVCDMTMRVRPVHAQSSTTVYIDRVMNFSTPNAQRAVKGGEIVAFSCANDSCYILSK